MAFLASGSQHKMTISAILFTTCTWEPEEVQPLSGTGECSEYRIMDEDLGNV